MGNNCNKKKSLEIQVNYISHFFFNLANSLYIFLLVYFTELTFSGLIFVLCDHIFCYLRFGSPHHPISTLHSSVLYIFYEPTGGSPVNFTDDIQTVAVG